jgi:hypothetical protein
VQALNNVYGLFQKLVALASEDTATSVPIVATTDTLIIIIAIIV